MVEEKATLSVVKNEYFVIYVTLFLQRRFRISSELLKSCFFTEERWATCYVRTLFANG